MNLRIWSVAEREVATAALWYEEQRSGLGSDFLDEYEAAMTAIEYDAVRFPVLESLLLDRPIRRSRLKRFPFAIVFEILRSEVVVYAVVHLSRDDEALRYRIQGDS